MGTACGSGWWERLLWGRTAAQIARALGDEASEHRYVAMVRAAHAMSPGGAIDDRVLREAEGQTLEAPEIY